MPLQKPPYLAEAAVFEKLSKSPNPEAMVRAFEENLITEETLFKLLPQGHPLLVQTALGKARAAVAGCMETGLTS